MFKKYWKFFVIFWSVVLVGIIGVFVFSCLGCSVFISCFIFSSTFSIFSLGFSTTLSTSWIFTLGRSSRFLVVFSILSILVFLIFTAPFGIFSLFSLGTDLLIFLLTSSFFTFSWTLGFSTIFSTGLLSFFSSITSGEVGIVFFKLSSFNFSSANFSDSSFFCSSIALKK